LDIYHSYQGHHINDPSLSIGFHLDIYHSHQCIYIVHQSSINQLLDINQTKPFASMTYDPTIFPNNQTIGINDNMIQQSPPLALMAIPTLMSTPITNY
jgi:hypothetical protein